ncbi:ABC transporter ATP-binding protein [Streptomyces sp. NBC_00696]|uniref:ABC transporter ATP-binding protein n=1 Tax=Streptomyces sp. NBC_00696 TaxID=2903672 RepID=UPI002E334B3D|nr:ABC transporter ATP-binding protein [Streptomyces sp. NBC_00696]
MTNPPPNPRTTPPTTPLIELLDVSRRYGSGPPALEDASLSVRAGEAVAILGPSGSGKSTLLNLVAGLDRPDAGTVTVDGVRVDRLGEAGAARYRRAKIGMVFQFFHLLDDLTVADNVALPARLAGLGRRESQGRASELLESLGIARHAQAFPNRLSGGERQRVAVARALMNRPPLLLADEPTGALDSASGEEVSRLLRELNADGQTIVLVTHDTELARSCTRRTVRLVDGRITSDTPSEPAGGPDGPTSPAGPTGQVVAGVAESESAR